MRRKRPAAHRQHGQQTGAMARRVAVTVVGLTLVVAAEVAATVGPAPAARRPQRASAIGSQASPPPYRGEPRLPTGATVPPEVRAAALRFVHDYALWIERRPRTIPARDVTERVIRLLEQAPTGGRPSPAAAETSVRIAAAGPDRYVVTSAVGNFLVGTRESRWLVVSLPGD